MNRVLNNLMHWSAWPLRRLFLIGLFLTAACASQPVAPSRTIYEAGLNMVRLEQDPNSTSNAHPATLTAAEVSTLLRGVRASERRNIIRRLLFGQADQTQAFREKEISILSLPVSTALALAEPTERVYFRLSHATDQGDQETTIGWVSIRASVLNLTISAIHERQGPLPTISKYDRRLPNIPEASASYDVTFVPKEFLAKASSTVLFCKRDELKIRYQEALAALR
jgi:hypothetical protein